MQDLTMEEKRAAIEKYCWGKDCGTCLLKEQEVCHSSDNADIINNNYDLIFGEHDYSCWDCVHNDKDDNEFPCTDCKNGVLEYERPDHPWRFEPFTKEGEEVTNASNQTTEQVPNDPVNHPSHYTHGMEAIDEMVLIFGKEAVKGFCVCNAWKYRKRAIYKNGHEDMDKSDWYINKYKELVDDEESERLETIRF